MINENFWTLDKNDETYTSADENIKKWFEILETNISSLTNFKTAFEAQASEADTNFLQVAKKIPSAEYWKLYSQLEKDFETNENLKNEFNKIKNGVMFNPFKIFGIIGWVKKHFPNSKDMI